MTIEERLLEQAKEIASITIDWGTTMVDAMDALVALQQENAELKEQLEKALEELASHRP